MKYDSIAIMVKIASQEFDKLSNQILASYDLTSSQFKVLKLILSRPEATVRQIDIEQYFAMTNPTVTGLLQNMEKKRLIERIPNPEDRRSKVICASKKTRAMEAELYALGDELERRFTDTLDADEKRQMKSMLRKILGQ